MEVKFLGTERPGYESRLWRHKTRHPRCTGGVANVFFRSEMAVLLKQSWFPIIPLWKSFVFCAYSVCLMAFRCTCIGYSWRMLRTHVETRFALRCKSALYSLHLNLCHSFSRLACVGLTRGSDVRCMFFLSKENGFDSVCWCMTNNKTKCFTSWLA